MKLAIIGSRSFSDESLVKRSILDYFGGLWIEEIVSGGAKGADSIGATIARRNGIKVTEYLPDWERYGKRAGFVRNEDIIRNADVVLAFWDGQSKGTANSLSIAKRLKKPTVIVYF